ncbi:alpha/beta fold hydrolase [Streptomyces sp. NPDC051018]|uniref:alpha/beta fold hydrolase n=1 Tax=Streptomyces sp. NPDC051018 TaxID=3365639 RepID=UPI00379A609B
MSIWTELGPVSHRVEYLDAKGVRTRTLRAGDPEAQAVVFLHGTSGHLEAFARNIAAHSAYDLHAIDMLGHGYTGKPGRPYEIADYVGHLLDYLDAAGVERAHIVGESLGGWVGARTAIEHPGRVISLQLLCAGGTVADPAIMERIRTSTRQAVMSDDIGLTRKRLRLLMADDRDATEELVEIRHDIYHQPGFVANIGNLLSLQDMERRLRNLLSPGDLARINRPALIVWGRQNPFGDVPEAEAMHRAVPGSRLELLDGCGHWPQHERAARYNEISLAFLKGAAG